MTSMVLAEGVPDFRCLQWMIYNLGNCSTPQRHEFQVSCEVWNVDPSPIKITTVNPHGVPIESNITRESRQSMIFPMVMNFWLKKTMGKSQKKSPEILPVKGAPIGRGPLLFPNARALVKSKPGCDLSSLRTPIETSSEFNLLNKRSQNLPITTLAPLAAPLAEHSERSSPHILRAKMKATRTLLPVSLSVQQGSLPIPRNHITCYGS